VELVGRSFVLLGSAGHEPQELRVEFLVAPVRTVTLDPKLEHHEYAL
jgi:hypothetical protein